MEDTRIMDSQLFESLKGKIVDFRLRPPTGAYRSFFAPRPVEACNRVWGNPVPKSYLASVEDRPDADERGLQVLFQEMDGVGVRIGVMNGRHSPNRAVPVHIEDEDLVRLRERSQGRLVALAGVNLDLPVSDIVDRLDHAVKKLGILGVCMEPGFARTPLYADDEKLFPIYQKILDLGVPLQFMSGPLAGPDLSYTDPVRFDRVGRAFPALPIILGHGAYPYVTEAIALPYRSEMNGMSNFYLSPDVYMFAPGGELYAQAVNNMPNRFLFGSAYSFCGVDSAVRRTFDLPIRAENMPAYMYENAVRLLKLQDFHS